jgi:hypothetical protein
MTKLMEALVVVGGLAALAYLMSKRNTVTPVSPGPPKMTKNTTPNAIDESKGKMHGKTCRDLADPGTCFYDDAGDPTPNHKEAPPSANLMLNQHVGAAKQLVASGGDLTDLIGLRKDAARAVMANPGQVKQTPLPPPNVGYVNAMKRQNLSSGKIIFNKL